MNCIKIFRQLQGRTQNQISEITGIDQGRLSRIEAGLVRPSDKEKELLSNAIGLKPEDLFNE